MLYVGIVPIPDIRHNSRWHGIGCGYWLSCVIRRDPTFLGEESLERRLSAILAADVVGYSGLMEADEVGTLSALKSHRTELIDRSITNHTGRIVKLMGDGALVEFPSVTEAVECAIEIQSGMSARNWDLAEDARIHFRIGINLGDVIVDGDDIYGDGVNVAARLEGLAEPGGICISDMVYQGVDGKLDLEFEDLGEQAVKNMVKPVRAYRIALNKNRRPSEIRHARAGRSQSNLVAGFAVVCLLAIGALLAWQMLSWGPSGSSEAACTDHLGLPVAAENCQEIER